MGEPESPIGAVKAEAQKVAPVKVDLQLPANPLRNESRIRLERLCLGYRRSLQTDIGLNI